MGRLGRTSLHSPPSSKSSLSKTAETRRLDVTFVFPWDVVEWCLRPELENNCANAATKKDAKRGARGSSHPRTLGPGARDTPPSGDSESHRAPDGGWFLQPPDRTKAASRPKHGQSLALPLPGGWLRPAAARQPAVRTTEAPRHVNTWPRDFRRAKSAEAGIHIARDCRLPQQNGPELVTCACVRRRVRRDFGNSRRSDGMAVLESTKARGLLWLGRATLIALSLLCWSHAAVAAGTWTSAAPTPRVPTLWRGVGVGDSYPDNLAVVSLSPTTSLDSANRLALPCPPQIIRNAE
jgi:hypothetical protein